MPLFQLHPSPETGRVTLRELCVASVEGMVISGSVWVFRKLGRRRWLIEFGQTKELYLYTGKALKGTFLNCIELPRVFLRVKI